MVGQPAVRKGNIRPAFDHEDFSFFIQPAQGIPGTPFLFLLSPFISYSVFPLWTRRLLQQPAPQTLLQPYHKPLTPQGPACPFMPLENHDPFCIDGL